MKKKNLSANKFISFFMALIMFLSIMPFNILNITGDSVALADDHPSIQAKQLDSNPTNTTNARLADFDYYHDAEVNAAGTRLTTGSLIYSWYTVAGTANEAADYYKVGNIVCDWMSDDGLSYNVRQYSKNGYNAYLLSYARTGGAQPTTAHMVFENDSNGMSPKSLAQMASLVTPRTQRYVVANVGDKDREGKTIKAGDTCYFYDWYTGSYLGSATSYVT